MASTQNGIILHSWSPSLAHRLWNSYRHPREAKDFGIPTVEVGVTLMTRSIAYLRVGNWIAEVPIPNISLDTAETRLDGKEKDEFLAFMRKMLQWKPEDRGSCHDIF